MSVIKPKPGEFYWVDLGATDVAAAKKFYRAIFGWTIKDYPMGMGDAKYSMLRVRGKDVGGLYAMMPEQKKAKAPPAWLPYILVKSADSSVKTAKSAGAKVMQGPMDVMNQGRMAVLQDPTGAVFAVWQPRKQESGLRDVPGTVCWHDLSTSKIAAAGKFYPKVFGWKRESQDFGGNAYHLFKLGSKNVGGMWPEPMKKLAPSWITHWQVASCAKTLAKIKRLGGRALMGSTRVPGMGRFAIVADPQGAVFGIIEFEK